MLKVRRYDGLIVVAAIFAACGAVLGGMAMIDQYWDSQSELDYERARANEERFEKLKKLSAEIENR